MSTLETLRDVLSKCEDGKAYFVTFHSGKKLLLKDFEAVDESIYERDDLFVGWVISTVEGDRRFFTPGSGIQFSLTEVKEIAAASDNTLLFRS
jgi:hypothetical protein